MNGSRASRTKSPLKSLWGFGIWCRATKSLALDPFPRTMTWFASGCVVLAILQPTSAMGRQMPPTRAEQTPLAVPAAIPGLQSGDDYFGTEGDSIQLSRLGIIVRNGSAILNGARVFGAYVADVSPTGPAAKALTPHHASRMILQGALFGAAVASGVFFPPAVIGLTVIACYVGESHDLVIAVDGYRVTNARALVELVADAQSGNTVYLIIVRKGLRRQVAIQVR